ncbi:unnamed protein product [Caenorhabditis bovis]|uniref:C2H2-type domain-containing protein n=1 Tax=Caenorhabditis bovis TaxID=2654633 RepID=A0A8S1EFA3_9PELO|nr:unnamed protein product [Caenorhabditis bovis]
MDSGAEVLRLATSAFKKEFSTVGSSSSSNGSSAGGGGAGTNEKDQTDEKQRALIQQFLTQAAAMNGKNGIEDIANRLGNSNKKAEKNWSNGYTAPPEPLTISNHTPSMQLSCVDCGVIKTNSEEMEIHIKTEHLGWLPFQCPICLSERASDAQMREHLHSSHRKSMNKFIYVDNVQAKRQLQILMDKAFSMNVTVRVNASASALSPSYRGGCSTPSSGRNTSTTITSGGSVEAAATAIVQAHKDKEKQQAQAAADFLKLLEFTDSSLSALQTNPEKSQKTSTGRKRPYVPTSVTESITTIKLDPSTDNFLANLSRENEENDQPSFSLDDLNIDSSSALASLFGPPKKAKMDMGEIDSTMDDALDALNPISVLDNVAALFGNANDKIVEETKKPVSSVSKKRVLGECSKCQKPVTAGARQMHMFFHLAKDENIFRFRCKFDGCSIEHYRKDQMENHQSKVHGKIDPDMMEDRSLELFQKCQELNHELFVAHRNPGAKAHCWSSPSQVDNQMLNLLTHFQDLSMELLGTKSGTVPGPTAAKAEIAYAAQQAANAAKAGKSGKSSSISTVNGGVGILKLMPDEDHPLQCRLCGKTMQNRIRGFHILWHMAKDKGINRYTCKYCDFGHDRSQSVQVHGKKEHGSDDCVEDRIAEYQDDVKEMSEACFGISSLFAQENKRRSKIPAAAFPRDKDDGDSNSGDASPSIILDDTLSNGSDEKEEIEIKIDPKEEVEDEENEHSEHEMEHDEQEHENEAEEEGEAEEEEDPDEEDSGVVMTGSARRKRRRFNFRPKKTKKQIKEALVMRSISMLIGGAQFYRKKVNEFCYCEKCGKHTNNRLPEHAYTHMKADLFLCPICQLGHQSREIVIKHMRDMHPLCAEKVVDNRLLHVAEIKEAIRGCYPAFFVDMPLPNESDVAKISELTKGEETQIAGIEEYLQKLGN